MKNAKSMRRLKHKVKPRMRWESACGVPSKVECLGSENKAGKSHSTAKGGAKKIASALLAVTIAASAPAAILAGPNTAGATELSDTRKELKALTQLVEAAQDKYNAEQEIIASAEKEYDKLQIKIDEIESELTPYREKLAALAKWQYVDGKTSLFDSVCSDDISFIDIINQANYVEKVNEDCTAAMEVISEGEDELIEAQEKQKEVEEKAETAKAEAQAIMDANQPAIDALTSKVAELREEQKTYLYSKGTSGGGPAYEVPEEGDVIDYALSRVGCRYVWGATGPTTFDCSGLVQWAYKQVGKSIPRTTETMYAAAKQRVPVSQAQPGDILYRNGHVALAVKSGSSEYVHAPFTGANVRLQSGGRWECALRF